RSRMTETLGALGLVGRYAPVPDIVTEREGRVRGGVVGIELEGPLEIRDREGDVIGHRGVRVGEGAEIEVVGAEILGALPPGALDLGAANARLDDPDDRRGDLVLEVEDVFHDAVVSVGPDMLAGLRIDELTGDAHAIAALAHAAFEDVADAEL